MQKNYWVLLLLILVFSCGGGEGTLATPDPDPETLENCPVTVSSETLEVVTWNIENFPQSTLSAEVVETIIETYDVDVIALQELTSMNDFNALVVELDGWEGFITQVNNSNLMLGYLYKTSEVTVSNTPINLFEEATSENNDAFTAFRRPYLMEITHSSGLSMSLINVHLKCCSGSEDRRRNASTLIKSYIDANLPDKEVIVLGDFNDEIVDTDNVFQNFIDDAQNFRFSTLSIAQGPSSDWSFPSFPSQIDQILISNELFDNEISTEVIKVDNCLSNYSSRVSDHRPVLIRLNQ